MEERVHSDLAQYLPQVIKKVEFQTNHCVKNSHTLNCVYAARDKSTYTRVFFGTPC